MNIKKILTAAAAATLLSLAGVSAASADPWDHGRGYGYHESDRDGWRRDARFHNRFADRGRIFEMLRYRHIRFSGDPYFVRGHYVVRSFDRFGRVSFVEVNPYTGEIIGFFRL